MGERLLNRVFNTAAAQQAHQEENEHPQEKAAATEEDHLRRSDTPMDAKDAIKRILLAQRDKNWFRLLQLPPPEVDDLGRLAWDVPASEVSKAYRRLSVLVHPDKNPGEDARAAFEALNQAHRALCNRGQLEEALKAHADSARRRREAAEAAATPEDRVAMYAAKKDRAKVLQKQEGDAIQAEILRQVREKQQAAKRKRDIRAAHRKEDNSEEDDQAAPAAHQEQQDQGASAVRRPPPKKRQGKPSIIF